ncbi:MAG: acetoacetate metabolism regulatory protein AtoC [Planctomycetaceae bacterium]|nr:MAG: acetoacetate metabolism regulatory protein AtoC [Planctomycetaceae bacterium]
MTSPVLFVLSRDQQLLGELPSILQGQADIRFCDTVDELWDLSRYREPQAILADLRFCTIPGTQGQQVLQTMIQRWPGERISILTPPHGSERLEDWARQARIHVFHGPLNKAQLIAWLHQHLGTKTEDDASAREVHPGTSHVTSYDDGSMTVLSGITRRYETRSPQFKQVLAELEIAARHDVTILLIGETGVGKTYLSRLIHEVSPRRHEPFLPVACGALPADLIESELFGHVKGAFTSAHADKEGKFIAARRGSILLDEIDVLGLEQQVKLLRVIETGEFEPVGSNQTQRCQARLIVASNLELQPLVEQGRFRPDLYYRLSMLKFTIPPLRHRKMDIIPLARKFIAQFTLKHGVRVEQTDPAFFQALLDYPWPGNVRELEHVVQRAVIYCREGILLPQHLPSHILDRAVGPANDPTAALGLQSQASQAPIPQSPSSIHKGLMGQIALTEREIIEQTLLKNNFSRTRTARELGISRVTLYNKMKKYGLLK